jgi:tripartite-type tricarboxylate transporter receptor subunit TctC
MLMVAPVLLVVRADLPARDLPELVAHIRRSGGDFAFGSSGRGQSPHIAAELFGKAIGVKLNIAAYRGAAPAVNDLLAGTVQAMFDSTSSIPHVREGRLRAIALANAERSALLPDLRTMAEQGMPGFDVSSWYVAMAPRATPAAILARLSEAIGTVMRRPEVVERLLALNAQALHGTPEEAQGFVAAQVGHWGRVLADAELKAE